jgi:dihydrolipoamide dehydrogenase
MAKRTCDVVVIGGGPGGYVCAIRLGQLKQKVICVEKEEVGGVCLNWGCVPSKALISASHTYEKVKDHGAGMGLVVKGIDVDPVKMQEWKDGIVKKLTGGVRGLFRGNGVELVIGNARVTSPRTVEVKTKEPSAGGQGGTETIEATKAIVIATGSSTVEIPSFKFDGKQVIGAKEGVSLKEIPKRLLVIGGGVIGLELGSVWRRLGAKVTVVELMPTVLPGMDSDVVKEADRMFRKQGLDIRTGTKVVSGRRDGDKVFVEIEKDGARETIEGDYVLVCIGRRPATAGIDAAALGLDVGRRGEIIVDDQLRTKVPHVYAIGDCVPGPMLAHKAEDEGVVAAEAIVGKPVHMHYRSIPNVVYTWPEIASVGLTEQQVKESGREFRVGKFPFSANGRARSMGETSGFVKMIADAKTDELLGCHIVGANASELIAEIVLAFEYRASSEDIGITVHAHPTLSESTKEAALAVLGRSIHF